MGSAEQNVSGKISVSVNDYLLPPNQPPVGGGDAIAREASMAYAAGTQALSRAYFNERLGLATIDFTSQQPGPLNPGVSKENKDCGPTSLTTALKSLGILSPEGNPGVQINTERERMTGADDHMKGTNVKEITAAAKSYGLATEQVTGIKQLNTALAQGNTVIEGGAPTNVFHGVNFQGTNIDSQPTDRHFVTVFARDPVTHNYLIDNPADTRGPTEKTAKQMKAFVEDTGLHRGIALSPGAGAKLGPGMTFSGAGHGMHPTRNSSAAFEGASRKSLVPNHARGGVGVDLEFTILEIKF